jgi:predicted PurR-regulated permease PerM
MAFAFGFWGFLIAALFMAIGALLGRAWEGKLDLRSVFDALTGRRSSS